MAGRDSLGRGAAVRGPATSRDAEVSTTGNYHVRLTIGFAVDSVEMTAAVIDGTCSLGGSESACLGLARALQARGHAVHIFAAKLGADAPQTDHAGVSWHALSQLPAVSLFADFDVFVALRLPESLARVQARYRVLWCQDLMTGEAAKHHIMAHAWAFDAVAYVSAYHRHQWETQIPELASIGYTTRNGFDETLVPEDVTKRPNRIIHITRPERGLGPLLTMWPALRAVEPDAELALCRYSSMYDATGWGAVCAQYDAHVAAVNQAVGGITYLGELGKPDLYRAIAESAVMWYPGVSTFAETSCIAAIESQACGTPFVGSFKGALPETAPDGVLVKGKAESDAAYQAESIQAVRYALEGCRRQTSGYRQTQQTGRAHVATYTYATIASEWETWLLGSFASRYETQKPAVLARLLSEDDHWLARTVARELGDTEALERCQRVAHGRDQSSSDYAAHALDPIVQLQAGDRRMARVIESLDGCQSVLDVACGSGAFALALALADPTRHVTGIDYAEGNITAAASAAAALGLLDRVTFLCAPVWDMAQQSASPAFAALPVFDGAWCGEFIEHVEVCSALVDAVEAHVRPGGRLVWSCPFGPLTDLLDRHTALHRGHVHHFRPRDLDAIFGAKQDMLLSAIPWEDTKARGQRVGQWMVSYTRSEAMTGRRDVSSRSLTRPLSTITAGIITNDTTDLRRCLTAVWPVVDEIIIGDCGADAQDLAAVVEAFPRKTRIVTVGAVTDLHGGFSEARNRVLSEATGTWFAWVDTDETLCGADELAKYLDSVVYQGFSVPQNHLQLDTPMHTDTPVRVFRRRPDIQFYGCIHEQPQMGDCNGDITPALQLGDVQIAHTGYLTESVRRGKALSRNLPLLVRDQEVFPDRELGKLLVLRDYANLALWAREQAGGRLTEAAKQYYGWVIAMHEERFADPAHRFHALARPYYEAALRSVDGAIEIEIGAAGAKNGLGRQHAHAERAWVRTPEQLRALLMGRVDALLAPLEHPPALDVEPLAQTEGVPV